MLCGKADGLHAGTIPDGQIRQMNDALDILAVEETGARLAHGYGT
jgi:hypothetical protein